MSGVDLYVEAEKYYILGEYNKALDLFIQLSHEDESSDSLNYIGCCYLKLKNYNSAISVFEKLIQQYPEWERPVFNLGRVYLEIGNLKEALENFEKAEIINPENEDTYFYLGVYYRRNGDYDKAILFNKKSLSINFEQSETHLNLGICYDYLNMYEEALVEYDLAYKYDNDCLDALFNKGFLLIGLHKYQEALDNLLAVYNGKPDTEVMMDIAHCYYKLKDYGNATIWVNQLLSIEPDNNLANVLYKKLDSLKPRY